MAAEAVAKYLNKKIYSINYANLESKYVGQTPKNIKKAFEMAKNDDAVLVFEEADSFLGKRLVNITQSADYGVNITRSVMLLELEKFSGVVIFTTNLLENYDEAFKRRILASVEFKMPDEKGRKAIFDVHMPEKLPLAEDVNSEILAQEFTEVSGADIKDIIFMAAINAIERTESENNERQEKLIRSVVYDENNILENESASDLCNEKENDESQEEIQSKLIVMEAQEEIAADCEREDEYVESSDEVFDGINEEKEDSKTIEDESLFIKEEESEENSIDAIVTMTDFREAYRNIKNRYIYS